MSVNDHVQRHVKKILEPTTKIQQAFLTPFQTRLIKSTMVIRSMKARFNKRRSFPEKAADFMTKIFGSITFIFLNAVWFFVWIFINLGYLEGVEPFDPFPFGLLTMIVSLEAIILSISVLISQNREQQINDLREEIDLEVDLITESEVTKILEIVGRLAEKNGIDLSADQEFVEMVKPLHKEKMENALEKEIMSK